MGQNIRVINLYSPQEEQEEAAPIDLFAQSSVIQIDNIEVKSFLVLKMTTKKKKMGKCF